MSFGIFFIRAEESLCCVESDEASNRITNSGVSCFAVRVCYNIKLPEGNT